MADAKIIITAEGADVAEAALQKVRKSVDDIGGTSVQTSGQFGSLRKVVDEMTPSTTSATSAFSSMKGTLAGAFDDPTAAAKNLGAALVSDLAGGLGSAGVAAGITAGALAAVGAAAYGLASSAASIGANLGDMADKTQMSVPALSRLSNAAAVAEADLGSLTNVVFMLEKNMGKGGDAFEAGLKKMGLSTAELKAAGPDSYLELITKGLDGIKDPADRAAAGSAVLGKSYRDNAAALQDLGKALELTNDLEPWTKEQADEAEHFQMQMKSLVVHVEALGTQIGRYLIPAVSGTVSVIADVVTGGAQLVGWITGVIPMWYELSEAVGSASSAIDVFRGTANHLPEVTGPATKGVDAWKKSLVDMQAPVKTLEQALAEQESATKELTHAHEALKKAHDDAAAAAKKAAAEHKQFTESVSDLTSSAIGARQGFGQFGALMPDLSIQTVRVRIDLDALTASVNEFHDGLTVAGDEIRTVTIPMFSSLATGQVPRMTQAIKDAGVETISLKDHIRSSLGDAATIIDHIPGKFGEIGGAAVRTGKAVFDNLAKGDLWGAIAAGATGAITIITKLFGGVSEEVKKARASVAGFESQLASSLTAQQKAEAGNVSWKATVIAIRDAYIATGKSEADAMAAAENLWASSKGGAEAAKAAIDKINTVLGDQKQDQADLKTATEKYKFSIEELGPAMQRQQLSAQAAGLENDFRLLVGSGMNVKTVIDHMGDSINDFLHNAQKTGSEVPSEMKPILQKMIEMGTLTDVNGDKITDLGASGITCSETMTQGFGKIVDKLTELINKIAGTSKELSALPASKTIDIIYNQRTTGDGPAAGGRFGGDEPSFANEGFDLTRPTRAIVGDNPFQSESVLHASTVKDIVRAARSAGGGAQAAGGLNVDALAQQLAALHASVKQQMAAFNTTLLRLPRLMAEAGQLA